MNADGRVVTKGSGLFDYECTIKDVLGNSRITFKIAVWVLQNCCKVIITTPDGLSVQRKPTMRQVFHVHQTKKRGQLSRIASAILQAHAVVHCFARLSGYKFLEEIYNHFHENLWNCD